MTKNLVSRHSAILHACEGRRISGWGGIILFSNVIPNSIGNPVVKAVSIKPSYVELNFWLNYPESMTNHRYIEIMDNSEAVTNTL